MGALLTVIFARREDVRREGTYSASSCRRGYPGCVTGVPPGGGCGGAARRRRPAPCASALRQWARLPPHSGETPPRSRPPRRESSPVQLPHPSGGCRVHAQTPAGLVGWRAEGVPLMLVKKLLTPRRASACAGPFDA